MLSKNSTTDVFMKTGMYGIHDPKNYHSFAVLRSLFVPAPCIHCDQLVIPLMSACMCLRCYSYAHRACIKHAPKCQYFTFESSKEEYGLELDEDSGVIDTNAIAKQAGTIPDMLGYIPIAGSELCIWRSALRAVAVKTSNINRILSIEREDISNIKTVLKSAMSSPGSFPGAVAEVVHALFMDLNFDGILSDIVISHARECLDSVVCAFLSICRPEVGADAYIVEQICLSLDRYMLDKNFGIMFDKLFRSVVTDSMHTKLIAPTQSLPVDMNLTAEDFKYLEDCALELCSMRSARDKLDKLVLFLQHITERLGKAPDKQKFVVDAVAATAANTTTTTLPSDEKQNNYHAVDTDDIIQACIYVINKQLNDKTINWIAESFYMASELLRDQDNLIGVEGYALTTLQQCLSCVVVDTSSCDPPITATSTVAAEKAVMMQQVSSVMNNAEKYDSVPDSLEIS